MLRAIEAFNPLTEVATTRTQLLALPPPDLPSASHLDTVSPLYKTRREQRYRVHSIKSVL